MLGSHCHLLPGALQKADSQDSLKSSSTLASIEHQAHGHDPRPERDNLEKAGTVKGEARMPMRCKAELFSPAPDKAAAALASASSQDAQSPFHEEHEITKAHEANRKAHERPVEPSKDQQNPGDSSAQTQKQNPQDSNAQAQKQKPEDSNAQTQKQKPEDSNAQTQKQKPEDSNAQTQKQKPADSSANAQTPQEQKPVDSGADAQTFQERDARANAQTPHQEQRPGFGDFPFQTPPPKQLHPKSFEETLVDTPTAAQDTSDLEAPNTYIYIYNHT